MTSGAVKMGSSNDELKQIQSKSIKVTEESVSRTREMLQLVNECKDAGVNTLQELYGQGDQLTRTEVALDDTGEQLDSAQTRIKNIETANNIPCCCIPCLSCFQKNPDRRRRRQSRFMKNQLRSKTTENPQETLSVSTVLPPRNMHGTENNEERFFPKIIGTKEEDEIESNLSHVSSHLTQLKGIALNMNTEVTRQNEQLDGMNDKAEKSVVKLDVANKTTKELVNDKGSSNKCCCCSIC